MLGISIPNDARIDGSKLHDIPSRMANPWAGRTCRVGLPLNSPVARTNDRVPRFSRLRRADSVRFVRFNMARPSLPPSSGGLEEVGRQRARRALARRSWPTRRGPAVAREDGFPVLKARQYEWSGNGRAPGFSSRPGDAPGLRPGNERRGARLLLVCDIDRVTVGMFARDSEFIGCRRRFAAAPPQDRHRRAPVDDRKPLFQKDFQRTVPVDVEHPLDARRQRRVAAGVCSGRVGSRRASGGSRAAR